MPSGKQSPENLRALHDYLLQTRDNMADYHAHKENMAWVATTIFLGGMLALMNVAIKDGHLLVPTPLFRCGLILLILLTAVLTLIFVKKQFGDRYTAALIIGACGDVLGELIAPAFKISAPSLHTHEWSQLDHTFFFPKILVERLNARIAQGSSLPPHFLASYVAIVIWTIACVVLVFLI